MDPEIQGLNRDVRFSQKERGKEQKGLGLRAFFSPTTSQDGCGEGVAGSRITGQGGAQSSGRATLCVGRTEIKNK